MVRPLVLCDDGTTMTTTGAAPGSHQRRAMRSADDSYLGGVAAGLAAHLGADVAAVRVFFVVTGVFGFGVLFYAGLWLTLPMDTRSEVRSPGLDAATRQGKRPARTTTLRDTGPIVAVGVVVIGIAGLVDVALGGPLVLWPALFAVVGVMVLWRQADQAQRERWLDSTGRVDVRRVLLGSGGPTAWARVATGVGMLVVALLIFAAQTGRVSVARDVVVAGVLGVLGLAIILGPWLVRLAADLSEERAARIRSQERADVAAHLHDSVLQTLALIQKSADQPAQVTRLARAQERDLRQWMYGEPGPADRQLTLAAALRAAAAEVEDAHGVPVEVVTVGDAPVTEELRPLVAAAREAVVNAAKHSGAGRVDVYAEVAGRQVEVFVRDRGAGFDPEAVRADRLGIRNSIMDRMERHGGSATVRSAPGEGTEVRLRMPVSATIAAAAEQEGPIR
jgi:signal transduction histidine kinase/phage shock protein PspC (stress-responsive transcriptional regulator)